MEGTLYKSTNNWEVMTSEQRQSLVTLLSDHQLSSVQHPPSVYTACLGGFPTMICDTVVPTILDSISFYIYIYNHQSTRSLNTVHEEIAVMSIKSNK